VDEAVTITIEGGDVSPLRYTYDATVNAWFDATGARVSPGQMLVLLNDVCYGVFEQPEPEDSWRRWRRL